MKLINHLVLLLGTIVLAHAISDQWTKEHASNRRKIQHDRSTDQLIKRLMEKLEGAQNKHSTEYAPEFMYPPVTYKMDKGLFSSNIHLNFHGGKLQSEIRNKLSFPDDNGFVTMNVLAMLLDMNDYGVTFRKDVYKDALMGILNHQDKNSPRYLSKFAFWNQKRVDLPNNRTAYAAHPTNIAVPLKIYKNLNKLVTFAVKRLKLPENVKEIISYVDDFSTMGGSIFSIPPDADDTGCALGVTSTILRMIQLQENAWLREPASSFFSGLSDPYKDAISPFLEYAYRPYSSIDNESVIDPRTYYWIRHFLQERNGNVHLITTWFQKISEILWEGSYQKMPFSVNNVDGSVVVNSLYGILSTIAAQPSKYGKIHATPWIVRIVKDSLDLVIYILEKDLLASHASSILLYYPSRYAFYYFVSRLVWLMDNTLNVVSDLHKDYSEIWNYRVLLRTAMQKYGTAQILKLGKEDASGAVVYWDDFLGNGDVDPKFEDRVFSTSMAFNALINTWTEGNKTADGSKRLGYLSNIPTIVTTTIERAAQFLLSKEADNLPQENAFFSASVKDQNSLPFFAVSNYRKSVDGFHSLECTDNLYKGIYYVFGVKGVMSEDEYKKQWEAGCFNTSTVNPDVNYNSPDSVFPYWSAPSYTYAARLLAIVKYRALLNE